MAEVAIPRNLFADILRLVATAAGARYIDRVMGSVVTRCTKPRETCVLMTENSASIQVSGQGPFVLIYVDPADDPTKR
jgi:hypothetical protein